MRKRVNANAVCSSNNYLTSKRCHNCMLERNHQALTEMIIKEEIVIRKQAYIKVFGQLMAITPEEIRQYEAYTTIVWR